jgi:tetratricopeptide (TPR) repeat protein
MSGRWNAEVRAWRLPVALAIAALLACALALPGAVLAQDAGGGLGTAATTEMPAADCTAGDRLFDAGEYDEARKAYVEALSTAPSDAVAGCAQEGIERVNDRQSAAWPTRAVEWIEEALVVIGLAVLAFFLLIQLGRIGPVGRLLLHVPLLGRWVSPRVSIEAFADDAAGDGKPGKPLGAKLKRALLEAWEDLSTEDPPAYDLGRVSARQKVAELASDDPAVKSGLEKAGSLSEQTKLVAALLSLLYVLLPIRRFTLSGTLSPPAAVAEATLLLEREAKLEATVTLTAPVAADAGGTAKAGASDYVRLAVPAAVWTEYEVARMLAGYPADHEEALSYVTLREGLTLFGERKAGEAGESFRKAILLNRRNWAAYMGLATAYHSSADTYLRSLATLEYALGEMREHHDDGEENVPKRKPPFDTRPYLLDVSYYRMAYSLVSRLTNGVIDPDRGPLLAQRAPDAPTVIQVCERLLGEADEMVAWCRHRDYWGKGTIWPGLKPSEKQLWTFLTDSVRPSMKVLLATALLRSDPGVARAKIAEVREMETAPAAQRGKLNYRTYYNLACFEALPGSAGPGGAFDAEQAIADLETAIRKAPGDQRAGLLAGAKQDGSLATLRDGARFKRLQEILGPEDKQAKAGRPWWFVFAG